ncbi:MAG TPA: glucose-6-phosphate dehydrogenase [Candidatus Binataceae bacterium]|nr:glucose-6-phosphate dehydrogenase [Candidatus Binataceae bacterium]
MDEVLTVQRMRPTTPATIVIFGASGDLAQRKLLPALYNLVHCGGGMMPENSAVLGFARTPMSQAEFRKSARDAVAKYSRLPVQADCWTRFADSLDYLGALAAPDGFAQLRTRLEQTEKRRGLPPNRIYYLSVPPAAIGDSVARLAAAGLIAPPGAAHFSRVVVEKPIGHDLPSGLEINRVLLEHLDESQVFRIDHYLGKETVQNLMVLRFANSIFERLWGSRNVDHVQITVAETDGVGTRAGYYDHSGALRDMVQNHILQLLTMLTMEAPVSLDAGAIREAKLNVLRAIRPIRRAEANLMTVRGRYGAGKIEGREVPGYLAEAGVAAGSRTETFVALKLLIDTWRWSGVPFYLRTGKRLPRRASSIIVRFKDVPRILFNREGLLTPNRLTIRIAPDEGFSFDVVSKQPGLDVAIKPVRMNLRYESEFGAASSPDAYERLLLDVMDGDHTLFPSGEYVQKSWELVQGILDAWSDGVSVPIEEYPAGSWGPSGAERLIGAAGGGWREP